ncbi:hypothetical protein [Winogradskya humida]
MTAKPIIDLRVGVSGVRPLR